MRNLEFNAVNRQQLLDDINTGRYYDCLYFFAIQKINDPDLAKDLIQETFLTALESIEEFEGKSSALTWVTAILKYKIYRIYRKKASNKITFNNIADLELISNSNNELAGRQSLRLDEMVNREFAQAIKIFIDTLPIKWQQLYQLKYIQIETTDSICKKLNLTPGNYWVLSHRLKKALKKWYVTNWEND